MAVAEAPGSSHWPLPSSLPTGLRAALTWTPRDRHSRSRPSWPEAERTPVPSWTAPWTRGKATSWTGLGVWAQGHLETQPQVPPQVLHLSTQVGVAQVCRPVHASTYVQFHQELPVSPSSHSGASPSPWGHCHALQHTLASVETQPPRPGQRGSPHRCGPPLGGMLSMATCCPGVDAPLTGPKDCVEQLEGPARPREPPTHPDTPLGLLTWGRNPHSQARCPRPLPPDGLGPARP